MAQYWQRYRDRLQQQLVPARAWYLGLPQRDRQALLGLTLVAALFLIWQLLWQPLLDARRDARAQYLSQAQLVQWIEDNAEVVQAARSASGQPTRFAGDWMSVINSSAAQAGVTLRSFQPDGAESARVQLEQQPFAPALAWLAQLEQGQGIRVQAIEVSSSQTPGTVNVRATLKRGG